MAESIHILENVDKEEQYLALLPQFEALIANEPNLTANMANFCAVIRTAFGHLWIGFYLVENQELVLGPFQGPVACTRIGFGKGVCGSAWKEGKTLIVNDVDLFPGHIACNSSSKSEIVVPVFNKEEIIGVLDIDSENFAEFDKTDQLYLEKFVKLIELEFLK